MSHRVAATLKDSGAWVVECQDCDFRMPAMNQTDARRLVAMHQMAMETKEKDL
jgi:hypothetical protein